MKSLLAVATSAVAVDGNCDVMSHRIPGVEAAFSSMIKEACGVDVTIDACMNASVDGSTGLRYDYALRDSRGFDFVATARHATRNDVPILSVKGLEVCNGDEDCTKHFLCNVDNQMLKSGDMSLPEYTSGSLVDPEFAALNEILQAEAVSFQTSPESMMGERLNLVHRYLMSTDTSYKQQLSEEASVEEVETARELDFQKYIKLALDVNFEFSENEDGEIIRSAAPLRASFEDAEVSAESSAARIFNAARALRGEFPFVDAMEIPVEDEEMLRERRLQNRPFANLGQLRTFFEGLHNNPGKGRWNSNHVLAGVNSLLPRNFDPRTDKRDASLPDTRHCFAPETLLDQAGCGSCWAFSITNEISTSNCVRHGGRDMRSTKTGVVAMLSPQSLMDCQTVERGRNPCAGGYMTSHIPQFPLDADYPYTRRCDGMKEADGRPYDNSLFERHLGYNKKNKNATCNAIKKGISSDAWPCGGCSTRSDLQAQETCYVNSKPGKVAVKDLHQQPMHKDMQFRSAYLKGLIYFNGAIRFGSRAHEKFIQYFSEEKNAKTIYRTDASYPPSQWDGAHSYHMVSLVGWGFDDNTKREFWIFKNSWGAQHADFGYDRIFMDDPTLTERQDHNWVIYATGVRPVPNSPAVPDLDRVPAKASVNPNVIQFHRLLQDTIFYPISCDTDDCEAHVQQRGGVSPGVFFHTSYIEEKLRVGNLNRYIAVNNNTIKQALHRDQLMVNVFQHHSKYATLPVNVPFAFVEKFTSVVKANDELRNGKIIPNDDTQTLNFGLFCNDTRTKNMKQFQELCTVWKKSRF